MRVALLLARCVLLRGVCVLLQTAQAELSELRSLVESLTRKNRHLAEELSEVNRAQDTAHTQLLGLQVCACAFVCACVSVVLHFLLLITGVLLLQSQGSGVQTATRGPRAKV